MARLKGRATLIFSQLLGNYAKLTFGMERSSHCSSLVTYWDNSENFVTEQMEHNGFQSTVCDRSTQIFRMLGLLFFFFLGLLSPLCSFCRITEPILRIFLQTGNVCKYKASRNFVTQMCSS